MIGLATVLPMPMAYADGGVGTLEQALEAVIERVVRRVMREELAASQAGP